MASFLDEAVLERIGRGDEEDGWGRLRKMSNFDWDEANRVHIARHGVSAAEAEEASLSETIDVDRYIVDDELRWEDLGETSAGRILIVVTTERAERIRVVTAFDAPLAMRKAYLADRYGDPL